MSCTVTYRDGTLVSADPSELRRLMDAGIVSPTDQVTLPDSERPVRAEDAAATLKDEASPDLRPLSARGTRFKYAAIAFIAANLFMALSNLHGAQVIDRLVNGDEDYYRYPEEVANFVDLHQSAAGIVYLITLTLCAVFYSMFFFRAMRNMRQLKAQEAEMHPGWVVGWNFIPIAFLFMPFSGVRQIWQSSQRLSGHPYKELSLLRWWWAGWIIVIIVGRITSRIGVSGVFGEVTNYELYTLSLKIDVAMAILLAVTTIALMRIVKSVDAAQGQLIALSRKDN